MKTHYNERMHVRNFIISLGLVFALLLSASPVRAEKAQFLSVIDGDSLVLELGGRNVEVRLIGIDAPEWGQEYGTKAKAFSLKFCYGRTVDVEYDVQRLDRYNRTLVYVSVDGRMLNEELVRAGLALAVEYKPNTKHQTRLKKAQAQAEKNRNGFWLHGGLKMTPRQWRAAHPKK